MLERIKKDLDLSNLLERKDRVVVAVSGGPDSMALLHALKELELEYQLSLIIAHANHQLRGEESERDEAFVIQMARSLGIEYVVKKLPIRVKHSMIQAEARRFRYQFFEEVRQKYKAQKIATGHNADDQVETVLFRILRGTGSMGLVGIRPKRGPIIRPLLSLWRSEILDYLQNRSLPYVVDRTNLKSIYRRNELRHQWIPELERLSEGRFRKALWDLAASRQKSEEEWEERIEKEWNQRVKQTDKEIIFQVKELRVLEKELVVRFFHRAYQDWMGGDKGLYRPHYEALGKLLLTSNPSAQVSLPRGLCALRRYGELLFSLEKERPQKMGPVTLPVPGEIAFQNKNRIITQLQTQHPSDGFGISSNRAYFDWNTIQGPLTLRSRQPGDRIQPLGLSGKKKVKEILIEAKVPSSNRDRVPILECSKGILWVVGHRIDDRFKVTLSTKTFLSIQIDLPLLK
ncbi:MAG: tRNA lysidine(34) synthetase TilS [Deltaproteobacteria bacterium]|nr:tRNA lysidine(34) synthetase TilS [Deltaproteobacteria bacterium]